MMKRSLAETSIGRHCRAVLCCAAVCFFSACATTQSAKQSNPALDDNQMSLSLAASYLDAGRPDKAMNELTIFLRREPNSIEGLNLMGLAHLALSNPQKAVMYLEKAWKADQRPAIGVNLSSTYMELKRYKDAERIVKQALQIEQTKSYNHKERLYHNLALVNLKFNRAINAEKLFKRAIEENPMFYQSHMQLASLYREQRKNDLALKHLESSRFACPACFEPVKEMVLIHAGLNQMTKARGLISDYRITEGITVNDRRRLAELEAKVNKIASK
jgi:tetratricopeptide (TPR) repeat protein